ncbi:tRNA (adenosine(37)-N6)-threonylcarbamoyltransferase complex ATPase subunit type 1 TsaE [Corynebacterium poyangense]|uniref:tRNA threonylcarbamoyladenosine biosynthesis protein TsaE n=1 Tax=Corynebacterium poyangense TaxID=2684405 RepID=A0A7H0SM94_9CORY|nr:tRNA (adenosine(37)-N6)-threonylcarbamoyltransferase complex ATPase subunit type 1 TsaE [Corynebacterium poyangense]MBZ8176769.1 tRNA (adenosine(37)-N6)-threonylcarbamoyltransferase complex ATPase subunit type 1 TsaE [Corynebacterium poyangense]QNQ89669.1 tRNA (adenosine(37)-N6)-threonylcarbamoyltransferase complex ATPase subunit type 1 TsaE [Corynebacterium poyangense]
MKDSFPLSGRVSLPEAKDTQDFGEKLGAALEAGDLVILDGPLGAGKTTLTQGIARGMGVRGRVTSPTFVVAREHRPQQGAGLRSPTLIHVDAYRLLDGETDPLGALDALDLDTELDEAVVVAEWGGGLIENLSSDYLFVSLDRETAVMSDPESEERILTWRHSSE